MNLHQYLSLPTSPSVAEFSKLIGLRHEAQLRQWQHGYDGRLPGAANCVLIEQVSDGVVCRWDLRPDDWHLIWPELIGTEGAPEPKAEAGQGA